MKVSFNFPDEFLAELATDGPPSKIVRVTRAYQTGGALPVAMVFVVAGFVNARGELVELRHRAGEDWGKGFPTSAETTAVVDRTITAIEKQAKEWGHSVRAGRFEEDDRRKAH